MRDFACATAPKRDSRHWDQTSVTWDEIVGWVRSEPGKRKEAGNYVMGTLKPTTVRHETTEDPCTNLHRRKDAIVSRSILTLDVDYPRPHFPEAAEVVLSSCAVIHTTFSSTPDAPRYRLLIPTDRDMLPDEYITAAHAVMQQLGEDQFDRSTAEPERYMFRPAAKQKDWYQAWVLDGEPASVEGLLEGFQEDLRKLSAPKPSRTKRDPFEIEGVVGAFNRAYADWDLLIEEYALPYEKVDDSRYHLVGSRSQAGMGPIQDVAGFVYSHHANDPAYGRTCSAFDLVRLHLYGQLDEGTNPQTPVNKLPSHTAMLDHASVDPRVTAELVGMDFRDSVDTSHELAWRLQLRRANRTAKVLDVIQNWDLIVENDPIFQLLYFNMLSMMAEFRASVPWREVKDQDRVVSNVDRWEITHYIEREYGLAVTRQKVDAMVDTRAGRTMVNPLRDYLESLVWDEVPRVEGCLPGVVPTVHSRLVARKSMVAAVARVFEPGCKWDHTLVLFGPEGLGKSHWIDRVARGYSSSLGRIDNKDTLLTMQRSWIMTSDEGQTLRKGDADALKEFLTRTDDLFRMPYEKETVSHPRHCVIWSTTNDETFLRRQEGNRRFLIVHCQNRVDFDLLTDGYIDQLWAEAVYMYRAGERLFLDDVESVVASEARERFIEEDALRGVLEEYLETKVPGDWWDRSPEARQQWIVDRAHGFEAEGTTLLDRVCSTQIWVEALGRKIGDHRRADLLDITNALKRIDGWTAGGHVRLPGYGPQLVFIRKDLL